ncbi:hypothetical protein PG995_004510 [Apiospora arundinis]
MYGDTANSVRDKHGEPIQEGDHVYTPIRGGRHEGEVEEIVTSDQEAKKEEVKNPPKVRIYRLRSKHGGKLCETEVLFIDQKGKDVAHNPETLERQQS